MVRRIQDIAASIVAVTLVLSGVVMPLQAQAADTGYKAPTATNTPNNWSSASNAFSNNGSYATNGANGDEQGYRDFAFPTITAGSTINGIKVVVYAKSEDDDCDLGVRLSWDNGSSYTSQKVNSLGTSEDDEEFGSSVDTWGRTWSAGDFTNTNFVLKIQAIDPGSSCDSNDDASVDYIEVKVYYTAPVNSAPVLSPLTNVTIPELVPYTFTAVATDANLGDTLTYSLVAGPIGSSIHPTTGVFTWTPSESQGFGVHPFAVMVNDGNGGIDSEPIVITVDEANGVPVANDVNISVLQNTMEIVTLDASDSDVPAQTLTYSIVSGPTNGTLGPVAGNLVDYTPNTNYSGPDSFTYKANDGTGDSNTATVFINIDNNAPSLSPIANIVTDELVAVGFTAVATDDPLDTLTYSLSGTIPAGAVIDSNTGAFSWTPSEDQDGVHTITVEVTDGGLTDSVNVQVTVNEVNEAPVATGQSLITDEDLALNGVVTATDADLPVNTLTYIVDVNPTNGTLTSFDGATGAFTYTPNANYNGSDSFTFKANDGLVDSNVATIDITINPMSDPACADGVDSDGDTLIDDLDPGCHSDNDAQNSLSYDPQDNDETDAAPQVSNNNNGGGGSGPSSPALGNGAPGAVAILFGGNGPVGLVLGASTTTVAETAPSTTCSAHLNSYLKMGANNPVEEVKKLQVFLNEYMGANLPVSGLFGPMTFEAVKAFQVKEAGEILTPWINIGLHTDTQTGTGYVYKTTLRRINMIKCEALNLPVPQLP